MPSHNTQLTRACCADLALCPCPQCWRPGTTQRLLEPTASFPAWSSALRGIIAPAATPLLPGTRPAGPHPQMAPSSNAISTCGRWTWAPSPGSSAVSSQQVILLVRMAGLRALLVLLVLQSSCVLFPRYFCAAAASRPVCLDATLTLPMLAHAWQWMEIRCWLCT